MKIFCLLLCVVLAIATVLAAEDSGYDRRIYDINDETNPKFAARLMRGSFVSTGPRDCICRHQRVEIAEERRATVPEKPERFKFRQNIRRGLRAAFGKDLRNEMTADGEKHTNHRRLDIDDDAESGRGTLKDMGHSMDSEDSIDMDKGSVASLAKSGTSFADTMFTEDFVYDGRWIDNREACDHFVSVLTCLYALILIVFSIVLEVSQKFTVDEWFAETLFYIFMYGTSILFFIYCYFLMLHPGWFNYLVKYAFKKQWISSYSKWKIRKTSHTGEGAGSLYLRLGTLFFGSIGIAFYGLEIFMCVSSYQCHGYQIANMVIAGVFTFIQMHFIFCNSKIVIVGSRHLAKLGSMHLVAVNVWTWFRFVLAKQTAKSSKSGDKGDFVVDLAKEVVSQVFTTTSAPSSTTFKYAMYMMPGKFSAFDYFGDLATFLITCLVEYSVIGGAIMFVIWKTIDHNATKKAERVKRKNRVRIDCSASSAGIFAGILFLIGAFVAIGIYSVFSQLRDSRGALEVFGWADLSLFALLLVATLLGIFRMRDLQYTNHGSSNSEFLDEILLIIGLIGELIYSCCGLVLWISSRHENRQMDTYLIFVFILRILQVTVQTVFILMAGRLRSHHPETLIRKPGKQIVTFLLMANVSLFFFHTFEGMKSVFGYVDPNPSQSYTYLAYAIGPLIVFYRFHSSACLAECFKHCFSEHHHHSHSRKKHNHGHDHGHSGDHGHDHGESHDHHGHGHSEAPTPAPLDHQRDVLSHSISLERPN
ncbi:hypothetical protein QR680_009882 [Steinernema hermaphroditum]|uniref:Uncharacterized protein n=1 Tax=Steinernema hermaphroditum TaxID=289476 RepID=A0AA39IPD8_9BILA|nr:hypothetical protein QR680_009882 [Steinernema hermaphroditum]